MNNNPSLILDNNFFSNCYFNFIPKLLIVLISFFLFFENPNPEAIY